MHGQDSTTSPFGFTSPFALQTREQLEQLWPRYPHEGLSIAVFVLTEALHLASVAPLAREQAAQLLATLRTRRALPSYNAGWTVLMDALDRLTTWYNGNGLLGPVVEVSLQALPSYACAKQLVQAGLLNAANHVLLDPPVCLDDSVWTPLFDDQQRLREELPKYPGVSAVWLFAEQQRALVGEHPVLRNRVLGAERFCPLPEYMTWRISSDATPYVEADLSQCDRDWTRCTVILSGGEWLPIAVQHTEYVQWAWDRIQDRRSMGGHVHIENSAINSPGAIQVIGSAGTRVNSPETTPPASPGPAASAEPTAAVPETPAVPAVPQPEQIEPDLSKQEPEVSPQPDAAELKRRKDSQAKFTPEQRKDALAEFNRTYTGPGGRDARWKVWKEKFYKTGRGPWLGRSHFD